jgi:transposase
MIKIAVSKKQKEQFHFERYNHPHPHVQKKMEVLYLKSIDKLSHELICEIARVTPNTLRAYLKQYKEGGIEKLKEVNFYQPESELKDHAKSIEQYLRNQPPSTISEASHMIEKLTGVKRGLTQTGIFIKSLGVKLRKVGTIPAKALDESKKKSKRNS